MAKIMYVEHLFSAKSLKTIEQANQIITDYMAQGFRLTLRQLYYQFVSRDLIANTVAEYKRLGSVINDARLAGMIDWSAIEDRTRNLRSQPHWDDPADIIYSACRGYHIDKWEDQEYRVEVWIEKEALAGVFEGVCTALDVPFFACRGYTSQSEMWVAAQRLLTWHNKGQMPVILHFGDHDPSGLDMTRDIQDRLKIFNYGKTRVTMTRIALNMDQIDQYNPPPNPAKETDSRYRVYLETFGDQSWELDALDPTILADLVSSRVAAYRDEAKWAAAVEREKHDIELLTKASHRWDDVVQYLSE